MLIDYKLGQSSIVLRLKLRNSSVTTGAGLTGLTSASSGLIISTIANNEATATAYTVAAGNVETITTLGTFAAPTSGKCRFKEVDATNHPGVYEIQIADARFAVSSAKGLLVSVSGATNLAEADALIPLRTVDPYNANFGLTNLDASISSRLPTSSYTAPPSAATVASTVLNSAVPASFAAGTAGNALGYLDATVSSRSTYGGGDTAGTTTLVGLLTPARAGYLDNLSAGAVSLASTTTAIKAVTDKLNTALASDGGGGYQYTVTALANAPSAGGGTDWTTTEKNQIRYRLGLDGTPATPTATPELGTVDANLIQVNGGSFTTYVPPTNFSSLAINSSGHISRVTLCDTLTTYTGNTVQTGDSYTRLGAPVGASLSADIAAIPTASASATLANPSYKLVTASDGSANINLAQTVADVKTATVGGALNGSWALAWGKAVRSIVSNTLSLWGAGNGTATATQVFDLDDASDPTTRTPR